MAETAARSRVPWREVAPFVFIAYGLTWGWDALWIAPRLASLLAEPLTPADPAAVFGSPLNHLPAMFGPLLAAAAMRIWAAGGSLRGTLGLRRPWRDYFLALAAPIIFTSAVAYMLVQTGLAILATPAVSFTIGSVLLTAILVIPESVAAFGEEYGWRGYLLPRLMPLGEAPATLALGMIWGLWHLPVLVSGVILGGHSLWLVAPIHLCLVVLASFPYTWLARATAYSPAIAAVFHGSSNWAQQRLPGLLALGHPLAAIAAISLGWLIVILAVYGFRWLRARDAVA